MACHTRLHVILLLQSETNIVGYAERYRKDINVVCIVSIAY